MPRFDLWRLLKRAPDPAAERDRCISQARESLHSALMSLIHAQTHADATGDLEQGDELFGIAHVLMHQVMWRLTKLCKEQDA